MSLVLRVAVGLLLISMPLMATTPEAAWIGMTLDYMSDPRSGEGRMKVLTIVPDSPAARSGLLPGDVITRVNGVSFRFDDWSATMASGGPFTWARVGDILRCTVLRSGEEKRIDIVAGEPPARILEERRKFQARLAEFRGSEVFRQLAKKGAEVRVLRRADRKLATESPDLEQPDLEALAHFLGHTRLRLAFDHLEPGQGVQVKIGTTPETGEPFVEIQDGGPDRRQK